jgi:L-ascorbate metabolism protein UlaG (beta-lactamase superfamily)
MRGSGPAAMAMATAMAVTSLATDTIPATGGDITITPIIHSSLQLEHAGLVIQVDPWSLADLSRAKPADLILITDDVGHHLDVKAIARLRKPGAPIVMPAIARAKIPDGIVLANGEATTVAGVRVESIAAYDIKPGEPYHPKGEANGYLITLGGKRIYLAGVTECVPEIRALRNIDVAFMPMNLPVERMTPVASAECVKAIRPAVVYVYHYDQDYTARLNRGTLPNVSTVGGFDQFKEALRGEPVEVRAADWYPAKPGR